MKSLILTALLFAGCSHFNVDEPPWWNTTIPPVVDVNAEEALQGFSDPAPITDRIELARITSGDIYYTGVRNWGAEKLTGECRLAVKRNGAWLGGKFDHVRNNTISRDFKNVRAGYGVFANIRPIKGETVAFWLIKYDKSKRTNAIFARWEEE